MLIILLCSMLWTSNQEAHIEEHEIQIEENVFFLPTDEVRKADLLTTTIESSTSPFVCWTKDRRIIVPAGNKPLTPYEHRDLRRAYRSWLGSEEKDAWLLTRGQVVAFFLWRNLYGESIHTKVLNNIDQGDRLEDIEFFIFKKQDEKRMTFFYLMRNSNILKQSKKFIKEIPENFLEDLDLSQRKQVPIQIQGFISVDPVSDFKIKFELLNNSFYYLTSFETRINNILIESLSGPQSLGKILNSGIVFYDNDQSYHFTHPTLHALLEQSTIITDGSRVRYLLTFFETSDFEFGSSKLTPQIQQEITSYTNFLGSFFDGASLAGGQSPKEIHLDIVGYANHDRSFEGSKLDFLKVNTILAKERAVAIWSEFRGLFRQNFEINRRLSSCGEHLFGGEQRNVQIVAWLE